MAEIAAAGIENIIVPRVRDIGDFSVMRVLPAAERRMVGPFVFLDQFGPVTLPAGKGMDVRPHPHIGLSTVTYLLKGSIVHRDSLGYVQPILPGDVNWMTAGRGIVHSERSDIDARQQAQDLYGLQFWVALPTSHEETAPAFDHYAAALLPEWAADGAALKVIAGTVNGLASPVRTHSPLFLADLRLALGAAFRLDVAAAERAAYIIEGDVMVGGVSYAKGRLIAFGPGEIALKAASPARLVFLGGAPFDGPRHIYWNFVSSSQERIARAKEDWRRDQFGLRIAGEHEFIPLPE